MSDYGLPLLPLVLEDVPPGLRQALAQEGIPFRDRRPGEPEGRFVLFDSRNPGPRTSAAGQVAIDVAGLGDLCQALADERTARLHWGAGVLTLSEEAASVEKRSIRRQILEHLRARIEAAGGIWLRLAPFPFPYRSVFNFRLDHAAWHAEDFDAAFQAIQGHESATSHYVCPAVCDAAPELARQLQGFDLGLLSPSAVQGSWTRENVEEQAETISRQIASFKAAGVVPSGLAGPLGRQRQGLYARLRSLEIAHHTDSSLAYDDLPFFAGAEGLLHIPTHPVSLASFLAADIDDAAQASGLPLRQVQDSGRRDVCATNDACSLRTEAAMDYFRRFLRVAYETGEPAILHGPVAGCLGRYPEVLRQVLDAATGLDALWKTSLTEWDRWWRVRAEIGLKVSSREGQFVAVADPLPQGYRLGVEYFRGRHVALMPLGNHALEFAPEALAYESRKPQSPSGILRIDPPEPLRGTVRRKFDREASDLAEASGTGIWHHWARQTLRRWMRKEPRKGVQR